MMFGFAVLVSLAAVGFAFPKETETPGVRCGYLTCGANTICGKTNGYDDCQCKTGFYGSGHGKGCTSEPECTDNSKCKEDEFCDDQNLCTSACLRKCPADVGCKVKNHVAECIFDGKLFFDPAEDAARAAPARAA